MNRIHTVQHHRGNQRQRWKVEKKRDEERGRVGTDSTLRGAPPRPGARVSSLKESPQGAFGSASG